MSYSLARRFFLPAFLSAGILAAQPQPLQPYEVSFFRGILSKVGSIDLPPALIHEEEVALTNHLHLTTGEAALLRSIAQTYADQMRQLRQVQSTITAGKQSLTSADRDAFANLIQARDAAVTSLTAGLLAGVRPAVALQLRNDAKAVFDSQKTKGAK